MKMICPECGIMGYTQIRKDYARIAHYRGYEGEKRLIDWHSTTLDALLHVNPKVVINGVINEGSVFVINGKKPDLTLLTSLAQTHNLESHRGKRLIPRGRGLESRSRHHFLNRLLYIWAIGAIVHGC